MNPTYRGTRLRSFRIDDKLYDRAKAGAETRGLSLSDVVRQALEDVASVMPTSSGSDAVDNPDDGENG